MAHMTAAEWDACLRRITNPTREDRIRLAYLSLAGPYPGPNRAAIAAILAHRLIDLEDAQ